MILWIHFDDFFSLKGNFENQEKNKNPTTCECIYLVVHQMYTAQAEYVFVSRSHPEAEGRLTVTGRHFLNDLGFSQILPWKYLASSGAATIEYFGILISY